MRLRGLHHVTLISRDLVRTTSFYRDVLGLALVQEGVNDDDPDARHFWFGDPAGAPGTLLSFLEYPSLPAGVVGAGSTHHLAFAVSSIDELDAWREYLRAHGVGAPRCSTAVGCGPSTSATPMPTSSRSRPRRRTEPVP